MDDDAMAAYLKYITADEDDQNQDEDDEDWVNDDEYDTRVRLGGGDMGDEGGNIGSLADLMTSVQEPRHPPAPDAEASWVNSFMQAMQDDPRYSEHHNLTLEMIRRMSHVSGDSHSLNAQHPVTFLDQMNRSYHQVSGMSL